MARRGEQRGLSIPLNCCEALAGTPLGWFGETGDIAGIALFLASDMVSWITEHTIVADGGTIA